MDSEARYIWTDPKGASSEGPCKMMVGEDSMQVTPSHGSAHLISFRDMAKIEAANYRLTIHITGGSRVDLSALGHRYDDVVRELYLARNELIMTDLLMGEKLRKQGVKGELRPAFRGVEGACEVRLYDTALVLMPLRQTLIRIRYSDIQGIEARDLRLRMELENGELLVLAMLGRELDPLWKGISDAMAELEANVQKTVKDIFPETNGEVLLDASRLLKEGRAASRQELEGVSPRLFGALEARLKAQGMGAEYDHLVSLGQKDRLRIGIKRSLVPTQEGDYIWFMVPLVGREGNAIALEASSGPAGGRATYFFRIVSRPEYLKMDQDARVEAAEKCMDMLTAGLQDINFRRQPIYLTDDQLLDPKYSKYRFSILLLNVLQYLRDVFIGRVAHTSPEEWTAKVNELLTFNSQATGNQRWTSTEVEEEPED